MHFSICDAVFLFVQYEVREDGVYVMYIVRKLYVVESVFNFLSEK